MIRFQRTNTDRRFECMRCGLPLNKVGGWEFRYHVYDVGTKAHHYDRYGLCPKCAEYLNACVKNEHEKAIEQYRDTCHETDNGYAESLLERIMNGYGISDAKDEVMCHCRICNIPNVRQSGDAVLIHIWNEGDHRKESCWFCSECAHRIRKGFMEEKAKALVQSKEILSAIESINPNAAALLRSEFGKN